MIFTIALATQFLLIPAGLCGIFAFSYVMKVPRRILMVSVLVFSVIGAYALNNQLLDIGVMLAFGALGFVFERNRIPLPPLILGIILGPKIENSLRAGLTSFSGEISPMFTRPICSVLVVILTLVIVLPIIRALGDRRHTPGIEIPLPSLDVLPPRGTKSSKRSHPGYKEHHHV